MDQPAPDADPSPQSPSPSARPSLPTGPSSTASAGRSAAGPSLAADIEAKLHPSTTAPDGRPLVAAIAQDADTGRVLMLAWMDAGALAQTLSTGIATYYSRSRQELWVKGATSGNTQKVLGVELDCDGDAVLLRVVPAGPACHTGLESCFDTSELALS